MFRISKSAAVTAVLLVSIPALAQNQATMAGCVQKDGDAYSLTDDSTKAKVQLQGGKVKAGQHVEVTGTSASGMFNVASAKQTAGACAGPAAHSGLHLSKASVISIAIVTGVVLVAAIKFSGRIGPAF